MPGTHTWPREVWVLPARWNVAVETDNFPLEQIFKKNINEAPSWLDAYDLMSMCSTSKENPFQSPMSCREFVTG